MKHLPGQEPGPCSAQEFPHGPASTRHRWLGGRSGMASCSALLSRPTGTPIPSILPNFGLQGLFWDLPRPFITCSRNSFIFHVAVYFVGRPDHNASTHFNADGHAGCFQIGLLLNYYEDPYDVSGAQMEEVLRSVSINKTWWAKG